jgi:CheY-specific phosphatase CheX
MSAPVTANVVNALMEAALKLMRAVGTSEGQVGRPELVTHLPAAPMISVTISVRGAIHADICWSFDEAVVQTLAEKFFPGLDPKVHPIPREDTVGEVANIMLGNATEGLQLAGYPVELLPPQIVSDASGLARQLPERALQVPLTLPEGSVRLVIARHLGPVAPDAPTAAD